MLIGVLRLNYLRIQKQKLNHYFAAHIYNQ